MLFYKIKEVIQEYIECNGDMEAYIEFEKLKELEEKATPKKIEGSGNGLGECPNCYQLINAKLKEKYCVDCGQRLKGE